MFTITQTQFIIIFAIVTAILYLSLIILHTESKKKSETIDKFRKKNYNKSIIYLFIIGISLLILFQIGSADKLKEFLIKIIVCVCNVILILLLNNINISNINSNIISNNTLYAFIAISSVFKLINIWYFNLYLSTNDKIYENYQLIKNKEYKEEEEGGKGEEGGEDGEGGEEQQEVVSDANKNDKSSPKKLLMIFNFIKRPITKVKFYVSINILIVFISIAILALNIHINDNKNNNDDENNKIQKVKTNLYISLNILLFLDIIILLPIIDINIFTKDNKTKLREILNKKLMQKYRIERNKPQFEKELDKKMYEYINKCYDYKCEKTANNKYVENLYNKVKLKTDQSMSDTNPAISDDITSDL